MQRGQRVLEDHRDVVSTQRTQLRGSEREQVAPVEPDPSRQVRVLGDQAHDSEGGDGLAGPGLADDPKRTAGLQLVADPVDGVHDAVFGGELHAQILDA